MHEMKAEPFARNFQDAVAEDAKSSDVSAHSVGTICKFRYCQLSGKSAAGLMAAIMLAATSALAGEWPEWGGDPTKNMISDDTGLPTEFGSGERIGDTEDIDPATAKNCKWVIKLGSESYGTPTIANGKVIIGTNNESPRNPKIIGDRGVVMCFTEDTGEFLWQLTAPKLGAGKVSDWEYLGMCSSTTMDGKYGYVVTNRGEVMCLDLEGMADGNEGYQDEGKYMAGPGKDPVEVGPTDADIVWIYDMRSELGVFPHNITSSSVVLGDGKVFASTSNGVDWSHTNIPAPQAPCLIALDAKTGELVGEEGSGIGNRIMHCNWSSPAFADGKVFFGAGDGFLYAYNPVAEKDSEGFDILPELWKVDCNAPEYRKDADGEAIKYATYDGPSEIIGTPVYLDGKVYTAIGQDPEHGEGVGMLVCADAETGKEIWNYKDINRTISTVSIMDGLLYICDYSGQVHCLDAESGEAQWVHDTLSHIWGSTLVADGKVYVGNEDGEVAVLKAGKELEEIALNEFSAPVFSSPVAANGVLYIQTQNHLYAFEAKE